MELIAKERYKENHSDGLLEFNYPKNSNLI